MHTLTLIEIAGGVILLLELISLIGWQWRLRKLSLVIVWGLGIILCVMSPWFHWHPHDGLLVMGVPFYFGFFERGGDGNWYDFPAGGYGKLVMNGFFWLLLPQFVWSVFSSLFALFKKLIQEKKSLGQG